MVLCVGGVLVVALLCIVFRVCGVFLMCLLPWRCVCVCVSFGCVFFVCGRSVVLLFMVVECENVVVGHNTTLAKRVLLVRDGLTLVKC